MSMNDLKARACPFCNYDEGWVQDRDGSYYVQCKVCGSRGPSASNHDSAIELWNGKLIHVDDPENIDSYLGEDAMGGVSAPMATLNNTPGIGNAVPATQAAATGAQFTSDAVKGSGDRWDGGSETKSTKKKKGTKKKSKAKKKRTTIPTFDEYIKSLK